MVMDTLQIRMNKELLIRLDGIVKSGMYANRADLIRDAVRRFIWARELGTIKNKGNSIKEVKEIRKKLSKELRDISNLEAINHFGE